MFDYGPSGNYQTSNCEGEPSFILRTLFSEACLPAFLTKSLCLGFSHYKGIGLTILYAMPTVCLDFLGNSG